MGIVREFWKDILSIWMENVIAPANVSKTPTCQENMWELLENFGRKSLSIWMENVIAPANVSEMPTHVVRGTKR